LNNSGASSTLLNALGSGLVGLKVGGIRLVLLLHSHGLNMKKVQLGSVQSVLMGAFCFLYFVIAAALEYTDALDRAGTPIDEFSRLIFDTALLIFNIVFFIWLAVRLLKLMEKLKEEKDYFQLRAHRRLAILLGILAFFSTGVFLLETGLEATDHEDDFWSVWWLFESYFDLLYFIISCYLAWNLQPAAVNRAQFYALARRRAGGSALLDVDPNDFQNDGEGGDVFDFDDDGGVEMGALHEVKLTRLLQDVSDEDEEPSLLKVLAESEDEEIRRQTSLLAGRFENESAIRTDDVDDDAGDIGANGLKGSTSTAAAGPIVLDD